jgi:hypothetical protein
VQSEELRAGRGVARGALSEAGCAGLDSSLAGARTLYSYIGSKEIETQPLEIETGERLTETTTDPVNPTLLSYEGGYRSGPAASASADTHPCRKATRFETLLNSLLKALRAHPRRELELHTHRALLRVHNQGGTRECSLRELDARRALATVTPPRNAARQSTQQVL